MNKHGQALITFVLILPVLILFLAYFIDTSKSQMDKMKIDGIITSNMENILNNDIRDIEKINSVIKENDNDLIVNTEIIGDNIRIIVKSQNKSIFKNLFKSDVKEWNFNYCGNYIDKKINKNCG